MAGDCEQLSNVYGNNLKNLSVFWNLKCTAPSVTCKKRIFLLVLLKSKDKQENSSGFSLIFNCKKLNPMLNKIQIPGPDQT
jgi:hypothetical protein